MQIFKGLDLRFNYYLFEDMGNKAFKDLIGNASSKSTFALDNDINTLVQMSVMEKVYNKVKDQAYLYDINLNDLLKEKNVQENDNLTETLVGLSVREMNELISTGFQTPESCTESLNDPGTSSSTHSIEFIRTSIRRFLIGYFYLGNSYSNLDIYSLQEILPRLVEGRHRARVC